MCERHAETLEYSATTGLPLVPLCFPCCFNQQGACRLAGLSSGALASAPLATGPMWKMCVTLLEAVLVLISSDSDLLFPGSLALQLHIIQSRWASCQRSPLLHLDAGLRSGRAD